MKKRKAFTLTEVLVVVVVIASLSAVAIPQYKKMVEARKTGEAEAVLTAVRTEQERRCAIGKTYTTLEKLSNLVPQTNTANFTYSESADGQGLIASSKGKGNYKYSLKMLTYRDGRICCEGQDCGKFNYPACGDVRAAQAPECQREDTVEDYKPEPYDPCDGVSYEPTVTVDDLGCSSGTGERKIITTTTYTCVDGNKVVADTKVEEINTCTEICTIEASCSLPAIKGEGWSGMATASFQKPEGMASCPTFAQIAQGGASAVEFLNSLSWDKNECKQNCSGQVACSVIKGQGWSGMANVSYARPANGECAPENVLGYAVLAKLNGNSGTDVLPDFDIDDGDCKKACSNQIPCAVIKRSNNWEGAGTVTYSASSGSCMSDQEIVLAMLQGNTGSLSDFNVSSSACKQKDACQNPTYVWADAGQKTLEVECVTGGSVYTNYWAYKFRNRNGNEMTVNEKSNPSVGSPLGGSLPTVAYYAGYDVVDEDSVGKACTETQYITQSLNQKEYVHGFTVEGYAGGECPTYGGQGGYSRITMYMVRCEKKCS